MKSSTFIIKATKHGQYEIIGSFGQFSVLNYSYPLPSEKPSYYINEALKNGKIVGQTQSSPDNDGNVIITISVEH